MCALHSDIYRGDCRVCMGGYGQVLQQMNSTVAAGLTELASVLSNTSESACC